MSESALYGSPCEPVQITQMAQIAVCNCHHNVEQQLCRLLLFSLDRLSGNEMALTQELINQTDDIKEGMISFGERRDPKFSGT